MDPITLALIAAGGSALFQGIKGVQQTREAKEMQKNLGARVNYQIPEEAKKALALYQNMAASQTMPGQQLMQNMIDMQQAKTLGGASRAATSSQDLLGVATKLGEKGIEQQQELGLAAAQNYMQRQQNLAGALGTMAGYQEKVTADKQQDWYERAAAAREMREAGLQNTMGAVQGIGQMGMMAAMGGFGGGGGTGTGAGSMADSFTKASDLPSSIGGSGLFANAPRFAGSTSSALNFSSPSYGSYRDKLGLDGSYLYPDTPTQQQPGFYNGTDMNDWRNQSGLYNFKTSPNKSMLNPDDWRSGFFNNIH